MLFSSHLLDEVERVSDRVAMLDSGGRAVRRRLQRNQSGAHYRLTLRFLNAQTVSRHRSAAC